MASHRILYAGDDSDLPARLRDALHDLDCYVVRSPVETARMLIRSEIEYSLLLFDETDEDAELESYARLPSHRERTPVIVVKGSEGLGELVDIIRRRITARVP
jgi:DNA-binding NtrC family response regulator